MLKNPLSLALSSQEYVGHLGLCKLMSSQAQTLPIQSHCQKRDTLRDLSNFPERAFKKVVFPHPGGPSTRVILFNDPTDVFEDVNLSFSHCHRHPNDQKQMFSHVRRLAVAVRNDELMLLPISASPASCSSPVIFSPN
ncbi:hypothetical protein OPV22_009419 [Ensete ventricosum]|uniref:Uncharacterized protein n=1 Tax=Ensete ventricosum TaxID=4639 RepID=A0AAV8REF0_ENSVE|nr:hypothetical protein OPV22_009419 [Ensete ventricosum]